MPGTPSSQGSAMELSLRQILQAHRSEPSEANRYHWLKQYFYRMNRLQDEYSKNTWIEIILKLH